ncbi:MAG: hypothetical protein A2X86_12105 [Bdellovibrionales bacterium GWA2_49_15]|nr:MAG: hypothetical protein A2X86_12105 [Bdellovibrionales bacterium GWA2_49_15]
MVFCQNIWAAEAVVIVLQTPLFAGPKIDSTILQYHRKGEHLYIRDSNVSPSPHSKNYDSNNPEEGEEYFPVFHQVPSSGFFETVTRTGQSAFIKADHVKILYADEREKLTEISPFEHDPTDYRLEEPLPPKYPIYDPNRYRMALAYAFGPQRKVNYPYPSLITGEDFKVRKGFYGHYIKKVDWDPYDRFYFGFFGYYFTSETDFSLLSGTFAIEEQKIISIGPYFSYDTFRINKLTLSFAGGITANRHIMTIKAQNGASLDQRTFASWTLTPRLGSNIQIKSVFPNTDFFTGVELQAAHPFRLTSSDPQQNRNNWNQEKDRVYFAPGAQFTVCLGVQSTYE